MIRLVFIITGLSTGGAEAMLLRVLGRIDRARFAPYVISLTHKGEVGPLIEALDVPVDALGMRPGISSLTAVWQLILRLRILRPDVVHTWMYHSDLLGGVAARFAGIRNVSWALHNSDLDPDKSKRSTRLVMRTCAALSGRIPLRILSCSERAKAVHIAAGYSAEKMVVIPNGFDLDRFRPDANARRSVREELGLASEVLLVGLIARYDPQKNHAGFVEAASQVHQSIPNVHFVFAGSGAERGNAALARSIELAGLEYVSHLLGRRDDIPRLMASLDVAASASHSEAFPNVVGEAMACGIPCVVTDAGDSAAMVGDTGRVVRVGDMMSLARELVALLRMPSEERLLLGVRARERVQSNYEIGHVVRRYEAFYERLLSEGNGCAV